MAIKTSTFGGVTLTGKHAKAFEKQFLGPDVKPNVLAQQSLERGRKIRKEMEEKGYAVIELDSQVPPEFEEVFKKNFWDILA